ncbi:type II toxin-antitoxin system PemK/MazF family toxin [Natrononativus amylolyticus]|uniref:type II toxin-antitoxin system PemK/MazF family toxin n=1 Tax=Natrononativus amylolyticus TaxID=2963434 RepID=UPI0020CC7D67|nr:type II toxin-antitoxin system PemK/MazF family toxin [Natrononativus amylolyticus]
MSVDRGTIVYAADPFKDGDSGRPWVIISTPEMPFQGEQYIVLTLSTKTWYENRIPIETDDVIEGGLPDESSILPWAVQSLGPDAIDRTLGVLREDVVDIAVGTLVSYLGIRPEQVR